MQVWVIRVRARPRGHDRWTCACVRAPPCVCAPCWCDASGAWRRRSHALSRRGGGPHGVPPSRVRAGVRAHAGGRGSSARLILRVRALGRARRRARGRACARACGALCAPGRACTRVPARARAHAHSWPRAPLLLALTSSTTLYEASTSVPSTRSSVMHLGSLPCGISSSNSAAAPGSDAAATARPHAAATPSAEASRPIARVPPRPSAARACACAVASRPAPARACGTRHHAAAAIGELVRVQYASRHHAPG